jgi:PTS system glucose-specific IIA component
MTRVVYSPLTGQVVPLDQVPDPVFAHRLLGEGVAVDPDQGVAVAPIAGRVTVLHSMGHAYAVGDGTGLTVLVHIGLDTVSLRGTGFERLASVGEMVVRGQPVVRFDLSVLRSHGLPTVSPVVLVDLPAGWRVRPREAGHVVAGADLLLWVHRGRDPGDAEDAGGAVGSR